MKHRIITKEQKQFVSNQVLIANQKAKVYNYSEEDFSIDLLSNKWKHKSWNTWLKGGFNYDETKKLIKRYIKECAKPYGTRKLDFIHLY